MRGPLAARRAHTQVPAYLGHQSFGFLHLVPRERLEVLLSEQFDGAIGRSLRITGIIVVVIEPFVRSTAALTLPHLWTQFAALLAATGIEMLRQALQFRRREAQLPLIAFRGPLAFIALLFLAVAQEPVVVEQVVKHHLLFVAREQAAFQRIVEIFLIGDINVVQRLRQVEHLARPHIDTHLPQQAPKLGQAIEQALTTLNLKRPQRLRGKVIAILLGVHGFDAPSAFCRVLRSSLPPTLSTSSWYLSNAPSVSRTGPSTRSNWLSASRELIQSSVSATPGALNKSAARSSCTNAHTCFARRSGTSGMRANTIEYSLSSAGKSIQ